MTRPALVLLLLALTGCSVFGADAEDAAVDTGPTTVGVPTTEPIATPAPTPTDEPPATPAPTPTETPAPPVTADNPLGLAEGEYPSFRQVRELGAAGTCAYLGEEWCVDSNGNVWPDFVEAQLGRDPDVDECLRADCGGPDIVSFDLGALQENTLFVLDASGSMAGTAGSGQTKMEAAKAALAEYVTVTPAYADLGLMVYGHRGDNSDAGRAESCAGIETLAEVGDLTHDTVDDVVGAFRPTGWTPLAASLDAAGPVMQSAADVDAAEGLEGITNRIILISDGLETCDGDPVASARALVDLGIHVVVDVIGFDLGDADRTSLQQVAEVTGGTYTDAADGQALRDVLGEYDAQRVSLSEALTCQVQAMSEASNCYTDLSQDARRLLFDELREEARADGEEARADFVFEWTNAAIAEARTINETNREAMAAQLEELRALYDEAQDRRADFRAGRNDKPLTSPVGFRCPFAESRAGPAAMRWIA